MCGAITQAQASARRPRDPPCVLAELAHAIALALARKLAPQACGVGNAHSIGISVLAEKLAEGRGCGAKFLARIPLRDPLRKLSNLAEFHSFRHPDVEPRGAD